MDTKKEKSKWINARLIIFCCIVFFNKAYCNSWSKTTIPFQLVNKLIVVQTFVDGQKGNYIIDTGCPFLMLNNKYFSGQKNHQLHISGFGKSQSQYCEKEVQFGWAKNQRIDLSAKIVSLVELEKITGIRIMGYIGYEVLKNYEVVLDYQKNEVILLNPSRIADNKNSKSFTTTINFSEHIPYITITINGKKLRLGLDSGAAVNIFDHRITKKLRSHFCQNEQIPTAGFNGVKQELPSLIFNGFSFGGLLFHPMLSVKYSKNTTTNFYLDGILGYEFLKQYKFGINYQTQELRIWKEEVVKDNLVIN